MNFAQVCFLLSHPIIFKRKHVYATRDCWYRAALKDADAIEEANKTAPFRFKVEISYLIWLKDKNEPLLFLTKEGKKAEAIVQNDIPEECVAANDWHITMNPPSFRRVANRGLMTPEWIKAQPTTPQWIKEIIP